MQDAAAVSTERLPGAQGHPLAALTVCAAATQLREAEEQQLDTTASQGLTKWAREKLMMQRVAGRVAEKAEAERFLCLSLVAEAERALHSVCG